jgi:hypothetical protein
MTGAFPYVQPLVGLAADGASAASALAAGALFENWFAGGWIEWVPGGGFLQRRALLASTSPAAGALQLTLDRWWTGSPAPGDALVLYPGCDGQRATCLAFDPATNPAGKFNNYANFRGAPFTPAGNPSLVRRSGGNAGAKK